MNLFKTLAGILCTNADVTIVVRKMADGRLVTSTRFSDNDVNDGAKDLIAPFNVSGSPEDLDSQFTDLIKEPLEQSSGIQTSMKNFEASKKVAQAKSAAASEAKRKEDSEKKAAKDKANKLLSEAKKLMDSRKWKEAKAKLTEALKLAESLKPAEAFLTASIQSALDKCKKYDAPDIFSFGNAIEEEEEEPSATDENPDGDPGDGEAGEEEPIDVFRDEEGDEEADEAA